METSKVFISYSWENNELKSWVRDLATQLRTDGVDVKLDQWELIPGDQIPQFMERMISENDFILIVCTPHYKERSDKRLGGVGYEGDIMTGLKLITNNKRKFIPIIKRGDIATSYPNWLSGIYGIDFRYDMSGYNDLYATLTNSEQRKAPILGSKKKTFDDSVKVTDTIEIITSRTEIKIVGIITDEVVLGSHDGTRGSGLDSIPFLLSGTPDSTWVDIFIKNWNLPPRFTTMHRPGIALIHGNKLILNGTTIEEVRDYHRATLITAIENTNFFYNGYIDEQKSIADALKKRDEKRRKDIDDIAQGLNFD